MDYEALARSSRAGVQARPSTSCAYNNTAFERLIEKWGKSNRTACLNGSQGKASAALRAGARLLESQLQDGECAPAT